MAGFNDVPFIRGLAVPSVCALIVFLGYFSQLVFSFSTLDPGPPPRRETLTFNILLLLLWVTYYRSITVDPGRYVFSERVIDPDDARRWCNKCNAPKPLRAHHCRHCGRCIPRMDHHCPWTRNCVSMTTFPHFMRFLIYTNLALWYLGSMLWDRFAFLWENRRMPAYLGPSLPGLISLSLLSIVCFFTSFALFVMLVTTMKSWVVNQTIIEIWEEERHETLADRPAKDWWDVVGPKGEKVQFEKLEFPYDVGFFRNMSQAMGTRNFFLWLWPLAGNPTIAKDGRGSGWDWDENGFNRVEGLWPPPDPEKMRRGNRPWPAARRDYAEELRIANLSPEDQKAEFLKRQGKDERRRRRMLLAELEEVDDYDMYDDEELEEEDNEGRRSGDAPPRWTSSDGSRLRDFGVEEDSDDVPNDQDDNDEDDDEDVPLAELIRRRKVLRKDPDI